MSDPAIAARMLAFSAAFVSTPTFLTLQDRFQSLLDRRRTELEAGVVGEARGIALIGETGSGKSTAKDRLLSTTPGLVLEQHDDDRCDVVEFSVPSPATLKFVGLTTLQALGYPLEEL